MLVSSRSGSGETKAPHQTPQRDTSFGDTLQRPDVAGFAGVGSVFAAEPALPSLHAPIARAIKARTASGRLRGLTWESTWLSERTSVVVDPGPVGAGVGIEVDVELAVLHGHGNRSGRLPSAGAVNRWSQAARNRRCPAATPTCSSRFVRRLGQERVPALVGVRAEVLQDDGRDPSRPTRRGRGSARGRRSRSASRSAFPPWKVCVAEAQRRRCCGR